MSVTSAPLAPSITSQAQFWQRLGLMLMAVAMVASALGLLAFWLGPISAPAPKAPFGMGIREAAPSGNIGAWILSIQSGFYASLQASVRAMKESGAALGPLLLIGFAYGVFHAAGPGHGKSVISAYLVADEKALRKGLILSFAAALVQACVAILIVGTVSVVLRATASTMNRLAMNVELLSFIIVALMGLVITWRKSGKVLGVMALARNPLGTMPEAGCDHVHMPPPEELDRLTHWRDMAGVALAAGLRPCAGALIVLVFSLAQGLFAAGIAATFAMSLGTALTTSAIAAVAVFAKALALKVAGGRGASGAIAMAGIELLAAAFVLVLGASLLAGIWASS
ncbi:nickel/cobalt transporter [Microvirga tunisiensis]|uniref:Nickel/cobalt efflux system n=1 Tax=Microvirga tunisiensis TaxID=2108360 RepID=A0A5N7MQH0_9HYPH|nr:nickel/cobalt transporter [Microvirga tunisiensis]MPR11170.1 nickel/cobalt transporter [Microvirga tunisiensis]MPR29261.1 nickel/cobalt transporter [Microvirga tunisiensis]